jgi:hypothetical protein
MVGTIISGANIITLSAKPSQKFISYLDICSKAGFMVFSFIFVANSKKVPYEKGDAKTFALADTCPPFTYSHADNVLQLKNEVAGYDFDYQKVLHLMSSAKNDSGSYGQATF